MRGPPRSHSYTVATAQAPAMWQFGHSRELQLSGPRDHPRRQLRRRSPTRQLCRRPPEAFAVGMTHAWEGIPFVLVGGAQGKIPMGRFHRFGGENHCRMMVSLCRAFGMDVDTFGGFDTGGGALPELLA